MAFDILVIVGLAVALAGYAWSGRTGGTPLWAVGVLGVVPVSLHVIWDGYRWQMVPTYVLAITLTLLIAIRLARSAPADHESRKGRGAKVAWVAGIVGGGGLLGLSGLALYTFPVFQLPEPTGLHQVGVTRMHLVDQDRAETFSDDPTARRELMVQVWYPADPEDNAEPAPYLHEARPKTRSMLSTMGLPSFLFDHVAAIQGHAYRDAAVASSESAYPVLLFSHGYGGIVDQNVIQMQELASNGYIVASIAHPYEAVAVVFPDGRVIAQDMDYTQAFNDETMPLFEQWEAAETFDERLSIAAEWFDSTNIPHQSVRLWAEDTIFVMDELERLNTANNSVLSERMDLARLGVFGHSFGGASAGQVCLMDDRPAACLNMDGAQWGDMRHQPVDKPMMFLAHQAATGMNELHYQKAAGPAYFAVVKGAGHLDFSDQPFWTPLMRLMGLTGSIGAQRANEVMNAYTLAFFDKYLKGYGAPLLDAPTAEFSEVDLSARDATRLAGSQ